MYDPSNQAAVTDALTVAGDVIAEPEVESKLLAAPEGGETFMDTKLTALLPGVNDTENEATPAAEIFPDTDLEKPVSTGIDCPLDKVEEKITSRNNNQPRLKFHISFNKRYNSILQ